MPNVNSCNCQDCCERPDTETHWNRRFIHYAHEHGRRSGEMLKIDRGLYPGGCMTGFILWTNQRIKTYAQQHPENTIDGHIVKQELYDIWLDEYQKDRNQLRY